MKWGFADVGAAALGAAGRMGIGQEVDASGIFGFGAGGRARLGSQRTSPVGTLDFWGANPK